MNINLFTATGSGSDAPSSSRVRPAPGMITCPTCNGDFAPSETQEQGQRCPYCQKRLELRLWQALQRNPSAAAAMPDQATCFFHPEKAFQACCQRCGRFVCALCDLQLGAEHVCPTCFERGRGDSALSGGKAEWRHRDVLYDSICMALGWGWIIIWPVIVAALPTSVVLHVKYRKAPRSYLIPRSGWRFWAAYVGFVWLPLLIAASIYIPRWFGGRR